MLRQRDMTVELISSVAWSWTKFSIREGGRTVGAGTVAEISIKLKENPYFNHTIVLLRLFF